MTFASQHALTTSAPSLAHALLLDARDTSQPTLHLSQWLAHSGALSVSRFKCMHEGLRPGALGVVIVPQRLQALAGLSVRLAGFELRDVLVVFEDERTLSVLVLQKELDGTYAANALKWGCGALNIDAGRIEPAPGEDLSVVREGAKALDTAKQGWGFKAVSRGSEGRWPANLVLGARTAKGLDEAQAGTSRFFCNIDSHADLLDYLSAMLRPPAGIRAALMAPDIDGSRTCQFLNAGWACVADARVPLERAEAA